MDFVDRTSAASASSSARVFHPILVRPLIAVDIGHNRRGFRRHFAGESIGIGFQLPVAQDVEIAHNICRAYPALPMG